MSLVDMPSTEPTKLRHRPTFYVGPCRATAVLMTAILAPVGWMLMNDCLQCTTEKITLHINPLIASRFLITYVANGGRLSLRGTITPSPQQYVRFCVS